MGIIVLIVLDIERPDLANFRRKSTKEHLYQIQTQGQECIFIVRRRL